MQKQIIGDKQDLTWLSWSKIRNSSGTAGSFLKAYSDLDGVKTYYKLSNYDSVKGCLLYTSKETSYNSTKDPRVTKKGMRAFYP